MVVLCHNDLENIQQMIIILYYHISLVAFTFELALTFDESDVNMHPSLVFLMKIIHFLGGKF